MNADLRGLVERLTEIAYRDSAVSVTVRADDLRAILSRLSVAQGQGWLPIESAPTGKAVLVAYQNKLGNWRRVRACYYPESSLEVDECHEDYGDENGYAPAGWYETSETADFIRKTQEPPVLWHELPPLPAAPAQPDGVE